MIVRYTRHNLLYRGSYEVITFEEDVPKEQAVEVARRLKGEAAKALDLNDLTDEQALEYSRALDRHRRKVER